VDDVLFRVDLRDSRPGGDNARFSQESGTEMSVDLSAANLRCRPRVCENSNSKKPSGKSLLVCLVFNSKVGYEGKPLAEKYFLWSDLPLTKIMK